MAISGHPSHPHRLPPEAVSEGVIDEAGNTVEAVLEDVVEENPSATADEGETVVE
jgi:hypothetical protein